MKNYNPRERHCAICGNLIITRDPTHYVYKRTDNRAASATFRKTLFFCGNSCMTQFEKEYPSRKRIGGRYG